MIRELTAAFSAVEKDKEVKVIILAAAGSAFCAGADLEYLQKISAYSFEQNKEDSENLMKLFSLIYTLKKPVIAKVHGPAIAGGCGLATVCDFIIAAKETATFGYSEVRIGFIPAIVMVFLIKRVGEGMARQLVLRGNILDAEQAAKIGLITESIPKGKLDGAVDSLARELLEQNSLASMGSCKEMLSHLQDFNLNDALMYAAQMNALTRMSEDCKKGLSAFLKKEKIQW